MLHASVMYCSRHMSRLEAASRQQNCCLGLASTFWFLALVSSLLLCLDSRHATSNLRYITIHLRYMCFMHWRQNFINVYKSAFLDASLGLGLVKTASPTSLPCNYSLQRHFVKFSVINMWTCSAIFQMLVQWDVLRTSFVYIILHYLYRFISSVLSLHLYCYRWLPFLHRLLPAASASSGGLYVPVGRLLAASALPSPDRDISLTLYLSYIYLILIAAQNWIMIRVITFASIWNNHTNWSNTIKTDQNNRTQSAFKSTYLPWRNDIKWKNIRNVDNTVIVTIYLLKFRICLGV